VIDKDRQASTDAHGGTHIATTGGTKRSRSYDDGEDNTDSTPSKPNVYGYSISPYFLCPVQFAGYILGHGHHEQSNLSHFGAHCQLAMPLQIIKPALTWLRAENRVLTSLYLKIDNSTKTDNTMINRQNQSTTGKL
jgi:hypothetical protein